MTTDTAKENTMTCTGTVYNVNPDAPEEGTDVHHEGLCPIHPTPATDANLTALQAMIGTTVVWVHPDGKHGTIGTLESVYVTDGIAANVIGLVDWSKNGKDYGRDFCLGPLYGATITPCPEPWVGMVGGNITSVYETRALAEADLAGRYVESISPIGH